MASDNGALAVSLIECKAYLRLERDDEDALLAGFVRTATALCEAFTGQWLMVRASEQRLACDAGWQRLQALPVVAISGVTSAGAPLAGDAYETDIDLAGCGWVRLLAPAGLDAPLVQFRAGLAADWNGVPEPLRQGLVRLVAHLFTHRDAADAGPPPAAVVAMWRPWRRMRLG
jgi:uncharacterized phiE125 gp8 family phage protein